MENKRDVTFIKFTRILFERRKSFVCRGFNDRDINMTSQVWCLADLEEATEWQSMPATYAHKTLYNELIGTLSANIISKMVIANIGH